MLWFGLFTIAVSVAEICTEINRSDKRRINDLFSFIQLLQIGGKRRINAQL
jgi:hypothetical protein